MSTKRDVVRLSCERCSTCEDLRRLKARIEAALRNARNLYRTAFKAIDSEALQKLEEQLKQTSAALNFIDYAIHAHLAGQHSQTGGVRLAA